MHDPELRSDQTHKHFMSPPLLVSTMASHAQMLDTRGQEARLGPRTEFARPGLHLSLLKALLFQEAFGTNP